MARPKISVLSASSIARYQRYARSGDIKAIARLKEAGIEVVKAKSVGRPVKEFSLLSEKTQSKYVKQIVKNLKELEKLDKPRYEARQLYKKISSSAEVLGTLKSKVYGKKAANIYFDQFRKYSKPNAVSQRISEIRTSYERNTGLSTARLTNDEMRKFYESNYYIETESSVEDSDGLQQYYQQEGETIDATRFRDFLQNELLPDYETGSENYERIMNIIENI